MSKLNRAQKKLLREWFQEHPDTAFDFRVEALQHYKFPRDLYLKIEQLNNFRYLNDHINRFVTNLVEKAMIQEVRGI